MKKTLIILFLSILLLFNAGALSQTVSQNPETASDGFFKEIIKAQEEINDFSLTFTQQRNISVLAETITSSGTLYFKKPFKFYWKYSEPEKLDFISNGELIWFYMPEFNQISIINLKKSKEIENLFKTLTYYLSGQLKELRKNFKFEFKKQDNITLNAKPLNDEYTFNEIYFLYNGELLPEKIIIFENNGDKTIFEFNNYKLNQDFQDDFFEFEIPEGAKVINAGETEL